MAKHLILLAVVFSVFTLLTLGRTPSYPYGYDEADYMYLASTGWFANYADHPTQPIVEFVKEGLHQGRNQAARQSLSEEVRESNDVNFYRHWHGPLYFDWLIGLSRFHLSEQATRSAELATPLLGALAVYFGVLWIVTGAARMYSAILATAFYLWSYATVQTTEIAPHQLHAVLCMVALLLAVKVMQTGDRRVWYASVGVAALAFCTLEITFTLVFALLVTAWLARRLLRPNWAFVLRTVGVFVGTVLVLWPGAILKLSFIKAYAFMAYLAVFRKSPWGQVTFAQTWAERFVNSPVEWVLVLIGIALFLLHRREFRSWTPLLIYGLLTLLAVLRVNTDAPRYLLPFLPAFLLLAALTIGARISHLSARTRPIGVGALCVLIFLNTWRQERAHPVPHDLHDRDVLTFIGQHGLQAAEMSVPQSSVPTIHYYFPHTILHGYTTEEELSKASAVQAVLYGPQPHWELR